MAYINAVSSVVPDHHASLEETSAFLLPYAPERVQERLRKTLQASGNKRRYGVLPLQALARLQGAGERGDLYRVHAAALAERAVTHLIDETTVSLEAVTTVVFVSGTGWTAPSIDTHLIRRFGLNPACRRVSLSQLGCGGGVAGLSMAAELVRREPDHQVLVVAVELPSLQLQLAEPSYLELVTAAQFGDGAAAALLSSDARGPEVVATRSILLPEVEEGGRIIPNETGYRLVAAAGLPAVIRERAKGLVDEFLTAHDVDRSTLSFVLAHPRGAAVLEAVADGLELDRGLLAASFSVWESCGNMVAASIHRALAELTRQGPPDTDAPGLMIAFGTGTACEMALLRWRSGPEVAYA